MNVCSSLSFLVSKARGEHINKCIGTECGLAIVQRGASSHLGHQHDFYNTVLTNLNLQLSLNLHAVKAYF